jgi:hypothetical protein
MEKEMLSSLKRNLIFLIIFLPLQVVASPAPAMESSPNHVITNIREILLGKPVGKGTVGVIPYLKKGNKTFILLGREDINGSDKKKAGTYSDLGGSTKNDQTFLDNMLRELKEESMGLITPKAEYVLNQGIFIVKDSNDRRIIYALIPAVDRLYVPAFALNEFRVKKQSTLSPQEAEKDEFAWLNLEEIIAAVKKDASFVKVSDIDGKIHNITLRNYFVEDFIKNPEFNKALLTLK